MLDCHCGSGGGDGGSNGDGGGSSGVCGDGGGFIGVVVVVIPQYRMQRQ